MYTHPGTQLMFMGCELGQWKEWNHDAGLSWELLDNPIHKGLQEWVKDLNHYFKSRPALYESSFENEGFEWVATDDHENCVLIFTRKGNENAKTQIVVCHLQSNVIHDYRFGVPQAGTWTEVMHSDDPKYGGSGVLNSDKPTETIASHGQEQSIAITLPPLGIACFELVDEEIDSSNSLEIE